MTITDKEFLKSAILIIGYYFIQIAANLSVAKLVSVGGLVVPFGSLIYAVSFTWIDLINYRFGARQARLLVLTSIGFNMAFVGWLSLYIDVDGAAGWADDPSKQVAIAFVFGGTLRIFLSSWITNFVSENVDIFIYSLFKNADSTKSLAVRSVASNIFSTVSDSYLFPLLAFWSVLPMAVILEIGWASALIKFGISLLSIPLILILRPLFKKNLEL